MKRPEGSDAWHWLIEGINAKTLVLMCVAVIGSYYAQGSRITLVEQQNPEIIHRIDKQEMSLKDKVDKEQYVLDQQRIEAELAAIRASQERVEAIFIERNGTERTR